MVINEEKELIKEYTNESISILDLQEKPLEDIVTLLNSILNKNKNKKYSKLTLEFDEIDNTFYAISYAENIHVIGHRKETDEEFLIRLERIAIEEERAEGRREKYKKIEISNARRLLNKEGYSVKKK